MRILICDRTGRLPLAVRWEAQHELECLAEHAHQLEAADIDLTPVTLAGVPAPGAIASRKPAARMGSEVAI